MRAHKLGATVRMRRSASTGACSLDGRKSKCARVLLHVSRKELSACRFHCLCMSICFECIAACPHTIGVLDLWRKRLVWRGGGLFRAPRHA